MPAGTSHESAPATNRTKVERRSDREMVASRTFDAPARLVFEAWTRAELFRQWWVPRSAGMDLVSAIEHEARVQAELMRHPNFREAYEAFRARREPRFE